MAGGVSLVSFNSRGLEGMHQRSYSVSSADQWTDATVIANSGVSTGGSGSTGGGPLGLGAELRVGAPVGLLIRLSDDAFAGRRSSLCAFDWKWQPYVLRSKHTHTD